MDLQSSEKTKSREKYQPPSILWEEQLELRALAFQCGKQSGQPVDMCAANAGAS